MIPFPSRIALAAFLALTGCSDSEPVRYSTTAPALTARIVVPATSIAIREVSLPGYAAEEGIAVADSSGAITSAPDRIWADDPTRAVTLRLTNALADLTGRVVASDPWPFSEDPDAVVEVRVETFVAETSGRFVAEGRYYVAHPDEDRPSRADRAVSFRLAETFDPEAGYRAIADARTRIISALALDIAMRGLR